MRYRSHPALPRVLAIGEKRNLRIFARASAVLFLGFMILRGLMLGDHLNYEGSPWVRLPGKLASMVGLAADDIRITGLTNHEPDVLLSAIGVTPGSSLIGFDAGLSRRILENLDWVQSAKVQRLFPNKLEIFVEERKPFAIWQRDNAYYVIDETGAAMSGIPAARMVSLPLVSGEGANVAAADLINQLSAIPELMLQVKAAARVGDRRWTLYLDNGVTVLLPEQDWQSALQTLHALDRSQQLLSKGIRSVDMRVPKRLSVQVAEVLPEEPPKNGPKKN